MDHNPAILSLAVSLTGVSVALLGLAQRLGGYESKALAKAVAGLACLPVLVVIRLAGGWIGLISVIVLVAAGFSVRPMLTWWQKRKAQRATVAAVPSPFRPRPVTEMMMALVTWLTFTVFMGAAPLFALVLYRQASGFKEGLNGILPPELVFMSASFIAADGVGRVIRGMYATMLGLQAPRLTFLGLSSMLTCIACIFVTAPYIVALERVRDVGTTQIPTVPLRDALTWFACAVCGAGGAVIAFETRGFAFRPLPPEFDPALRVKPYPAAGD